MAVLPARAERWSRAEYDRLVEAGLLESGDQVGLPGGELSVAGSQGRAHFTAIQLNLIDRVLEIYREAGPERAARAANLLP